MRFVRLSPTICLFCIFHEFARRPVRYFNFDNLPTCISVHWVRSLFHLQKLALKPNVSTAILLASLDVLKSLVNFTHDSISFVFVLMGRMLKTLYSSSLVRTQLKSSHSASFIMVLVVMVLIMVPSYGKR